MTFSILIKLTETSHLVAKPFLSQCPRFYDDTFSLKAAHLMFGLTKSVTRLQLV